jgi:NAD(P)-dependent dehydrogenase (short-subunit alcohol dehydrogenase family)
MSAPRKISQRTSLVTGGTQGIGRAVALELARRGDRVLFVGRNPDLAGAALSELRAVRPELEHGFIPADLALLSETARVGSEIQRLTSRLDSVVLCAGVLSTIPEWTEEGLERSFVLNYLSRYLLVRNLLAKLQEAPSGRVVLVSNAGQYKDTLDFDDLQHHRGKPGLHVAGRTQFANDLFTVELAERTRASTLDVTCVFPGVTRTAVFENARGLSPFMRRLACAAQWFGHSAEKAAVTPVYLAHDAAAVNTSGRFFGPALEQISVPERARRVDRRARLWSVSEELTARYLAAAETLERPPRLATAAR